MVHARRKKIKTFHENWNILIVADAKYILELFQIEIIATKEDSEENIVSFSLSVSLLYKQYCSALLKSRKQTKQAQKLR